MIALLDPGMPQEVYISHTRCLGVSSTRPVHLQLMRADSARRLCRGLAGRRRRFIYIRRTQEDGRGAVGGWTSSLRRGAWGQTRCTAGRHPGRTVTFGRCARVGHVQGEFPLHPVSRGIQFSPVVGVENSALRFKVFLSELISIVDVTAILDRVLHHAITTRDGPLRAETGPQPEPDKGPIGLCLLSRSRHHGRLTHPL